MLFYSEFYFVKVDEKENYFYIYLSKQHSLYKEKHIS